MLPEKINIRIEKTKDCWNWTGEISCYGYGRVYFKGKKMVAHRLVYELLKGSIPQDKELDHLCRNRKCVNPEHLDPVSRKENILRGKGITAICSKKTHCIRGHELSGYNAKLRVASKGKKWASKGEYRTCRKCDVIRNREYRARKRLKV